MILGYGMQDPDNWDTDAYGRPVDPYQDEWDAIDADRREKKRTRELLGLGEPIKPHRIVNPQPSCQPRVSGNHRTVVRYSGAFRCTRCGLEYESVYPNDGPVVSIGFRVTKFGDPQRQGDGERVGYEPCEMGLAWLGVLR